MVGRRRHVEHGRDGAHLGERVKDLGGVVEERRDERVGLGADAEKGVARVVESGIGQAGHVPQGRVARILDSVLVEEPVVGYPELASRLGRCSAAARLPLEHDDRGAFAMGGQGGGESGRATAHDDEVERELRFGGVHRR